jgi:hypothetical protein
MGQKLTLRPARVMSALPSIADIRRCTWDDRKVPVAGVVAQFVSASGATPAGRRWCRRPRARANRPHDVHDAALAAVREALGEIDASAVDKLSTAGDPGVRGASINSDIIF